MKEKEVEQLLEQIYSKLEGFEEFVREWTNVQSVDVEKLLVLNISNFVKELYEKQTDDQWLTWIQMLEFIDDKLNL